MARRRYIVMPVEGWRSLGMLGFLDQKPLHEIVRAARLDAPLSLAFVGGRLGTPSGGTGVARFADASYRIIATSHEDGPKLVDMQAKAASRLNRELPNAIIEPEQRVVAAVRAAARVAPKAGWGRRGKEQGRSLRVRVVTPDGAPIPGARILLYAKADTPQGAAARTRSRGSAAIRVPPGTRTLPRVVIEPPPGFFGLDKASVAAAGDEVVLTLEPVAPSATDGTHRWRADLDANAGAGVRIGIVDTGVDAHPDLAHVVRVDIFDQDPDASIAPHPHATHVAGLIGAQSGLFRGLAPASDLTSLRVTPLGSCETGSFFLGDGIEKAAVDHDLHLINISMTCADPSVFLSKAGAVAYQNGAICIAAAGNEGQDVVASPAAAKRFLAVTAYGDQAVFAVGAPELSDLSDVASSQDANLRRANFSNWGPETDFIGPGVGIISCHAKGGYAADSGTSFAAPVVTGLAAAMLSKHHPEILAMPKGPARASAIMRALLERGRDLGFEFETQGIGIINAA